MDPKQQERIERLRKMSENLKNHLDFGNNSMTSFSNMSLPILTLTLHCYKVTLKLDKGLNLLSPLQVSLLNDLIDQARIEILKQDPDYVEE